MTTAHVRCALCGWRAVRVSRHPCRKRCVHCDGPMKRYQPSPGGPNWSPTGPAIDLLDSIARRPHATVLWLVSDTGRSELTVREALQRLVHRELVARSGRVSLGCGRGTTPWQYTITTAGRRLLRATRA